jgi:DNA-directed RNA polymerase specialized sigma24 family protein
VDEWAVESANEEPAVDHEQDQEKNLTAAARLTKLATAAFPRSKSRARKSHKGRPGTAPSRRAKGRAAEERGEAIARLMGPLWGMAWRLAGPDSDVAEELRAHVLLKCEEGRYDPRKGEFPAWARIVMKRHLITIKQSRGRAAGGEESYPERADAHREAVADDTLTAAFPAADLARIRKWSPRKRAMLLARSLLWGKLPAAMWAETLAALGLPATFPGAEFEGMSVAERNSYLAETFGVPRNTIHVQMNRWLRHLLELQFVRELIEHTRGPGR